MARAAGAAVPASVRRPPVMRARGPTSWSHGHRLRGVVVYHHGCALLEVGGNGLQRLIVTRPCLHPCLWAAVHLLGTSADGAGITERKNELRDKSSGQGELCQDGAVHLQLIERPFDRQDELEPSVRLKLCHLRRTQQLQSSHLLEIDLLHSMAVERA